MRLHTPALSVLIFAVVFSCCGEGDTDSSSGLIGLDPYPEPAVNPPEIVSVPETLHVDDRSYILVSYLQRDFMPVCPPDGMPMNAYVTLREIHSLAVSSDLVPLRVWVIDDCAVWTSYLTPVDQPSTPPCELPYVARNGPKWEPKIYVDVIVEIRRLPDKGRLYIKEEDAYIYRTD